MAQPCTKSRAVLGLRWNALLNEAATAEKTRIIHHSVKDHAIVGLFWESLKPT